MQFRLGRKEFSLTLNDFTISCGFYDSIFVTSSECENVVHDFGTESASSF